MSHLDIRDPRLGLRPAAADPANFDTRVAVRCVLDALAQPGDRAISAPALGLPLRILGIRQNDISTCLLNPRIVSTGPIRALRGETSPHTFHIKRNSWRALSLTVEGIGLSGRAQRIDVPQNAVLAVQQAFDLFDSPAPFDWMTAFHHLWVELRRSPFEPRFAQLNHALHSCPTTASTVGPLRLADPDVVRVYCDADMPLCGLSASNTLVPIEANARQLLALMTQFSTMSGVEINDLSLLGAMTSALLLSPNAQFYVKTTRPAQAAIAALGFAQWITPAPAGATKTEAESLIFGPEAPLDPADLGRAAQHTAGRNGATFILCTHMPESFEARLHECFSHLWCYDGPGTADKIYIGRKTELDAGLARQRLLTAATRVSTASFTSLGQTPGWYLRKDGQKVAM